ncbi:hypothetical protein RUM43_006307 [Polyplax serrata]|uniref:Uncharacterized protein n=1 Tax=Polyplax serrata TaxID=468196 RepID=A0AAN8S225_POLSC
MSGSGSQQDISRTFRHGRETVEFSVKGPIGVSISDDQLTNSGCAALDLIFTAPSKVGEITFRNYYTMWLSILVKTKVTPSLDDIPGNMNFLSSPSNYGKEDSISEWTKSVPKKVIMPYPHYETGSQDVVSIVASESLVEWKNLVAMRLILRQPSPVWKTFHVEEINVYKDVPRRAPNKESSAESLMLLIKRQTIAALKWIPNTESNTQSSGGYEFSNLPQP